MIVAEAEARLAAFFASLPLDAFFAAVGDHRSIDLHDGGQHPRGTLLGHDPVSAILAAFATHAAKLDCHSSAPLGPPPGPQSVADATAFRAMIDAHHERGYTVRVPDADALSPKLQELARALEILLHVPVSSSVFWSRASARAKIHFDNNDNISVQLAGRKRWFVSTDPSPLLHSDRSRSDPEPNLDHHRVIDVEPGDLVYIPRGLPHATESTADSIHVSILFTPLTWREAVIAAVDHFADLARPLRATAATRIAGASGLGGAMGPTVEEAVGRLLAGLRQPGFLETALSKRSSEAIGALARRVPQTSPLLLTGATRVRHARLAAMHHFDTGAGFDLGVPGGHVMLHTAAGPALEFIAATQGFAVRDVPGLPAEHRTALIDRLIVAGLLEADV